MGQLRGHEVVIKIEDSRLEYPSEDDQNGGDLGSHEQVMEAEPILMLPPSPSSNWVIWKVAEVRKPGAQGRGFLPGDQT